MTRVLRPPAHHGQPSPLAHLSDAGHEVVGQHQEAGAGPDHGGDDAGGLQVAALLGLQVDVAHDGHEHGQPQGRHVGRDADVAVHSHVHRPPVRVLGGGGDQGAL